MKLAEKIAMLRRRGLSQEELAQQLHVSRQAISRWEQGSAMPDVGNLLQLSKVFQVSTDQLLDEQMSWEPATVGAGQGTKGGARQVVVMLLAAEVAALLLMCCTVFVMQNWVFGFLAFLPFVVAVAGMEFLWQRQRSEEVRKLRRRFYQISAWLGLYFPLRFVIEVVMAWYPRPYSSGVLELVVVLCYLLAAAVVTLFLHKGR